MTIIIRCSGCGGWNVAGRVCMTCALIEVAA